MSALCLSPEAVEELAEAAAWHRTQRPGLEIEFLTEVRRVLPLIETSPASFPRLLDLPADLVVRRALLYTPTPPVIAPQHADDRLHDLAVRLGM